MDKHVVGETEAVVDTQRTRITFLLRRRKLQ